MDSLLSLLLFSGLILGVYSAVYLERQFPKSGHEGQCYGKEENIYYNKGEEMKWNLKICGRKLCKGSTGKDSTYVEIQTCGKYRETPGCRVKVDNDLPYPKCCPRIICPNPQDLGEHVSGWTQILPRSNFSG